MMNADYAIIGGGVVGLSIAWGLLKKGYSVIILDGDDNSFRASRGNFGLIWVQSKGIDLPEYAQWSQKSATAWAGFSDELCEHSEYSLSLEQKGGFDFHLSEASLQIQLSHYAKLKEKLDGNYPYEVLRGSDLKHAEPHIGPKVVGAILHHQDGHVNPLKLLKTLAFEVRRLGALIKTGCQVVEIKKNGAFTITTKSGENFQSKKIVLSAGLGSIKLAPQLGFKTPIKAERGQILITEKMPKILNRPSGYLRQVNEGGIQIGDSKESVGFNEGTTIATVSAIAARAIDTCPILGKVKLVRSWGALRIKTPDGFPVYQQSTTMEGAYLVTCHSGVTLAAAHAKFLPNWLEGNKDAPNLEVFNEQRFTIS